MTAIAKASALGLALALGLAAPAQARKISEYPTEGGWWVRAYVANSTNVFTHCDIAKTFPNGTSLHFIMNPARTMNIGISRPEWNMPPGRGYGGMVRIDDRFQRYYNGTVRPNFRKFILLTVGSDALIRRHIMSGRTMTIEINGRRHPFSLRGTRQAYTRLRRCVATNGRRTTTAQPSRYGAIAAHRQGTRTGMAWNAKDRGDADARALAECGADCTVVMRFTGRRRCGAVARGADGLGWGIGLTRSAASRRALAGCRAQTSGCRVKVLNCNSR